MEQTGGLSERASAISFNLIQALPAASLFLFSILPYMPDGLKFRHQILNVLRDIAPNSSTYRLAAGVIRDLFEKHVEMFSFGFLLLSYYASNALMGLIRTFDRSITEVKSNIITQRWRAIRLMFMIITLILISLTLLLLQEQLSKRFHKILQLNKKDFIYWWSPLKSIIIALFIFLMTALIYRYGPNVKRKWPLLTPGSVIASLLTISTTLLFSYWVNRFASYNKVYGSIGTIIIILMIFYLNSIILLIGFELNVSIKKLDKSYTRKVLKNKKAHPGKEGPAVQNS